MKADYSWVRKCFRLDHNPLLECSRNILLTNFNNEFHNSPFNQKPAYFDHYLQEQALFAKRLGQEGYVIHWCEEEKSLKEFISNKKVAYDHLPGSYEESITDHLDCELLPVEHLNYLIKDKHLALGKMKEKFGFSKFRKCVEKSALNVKSTETDKDSEAYQVFARYLLSGAPSNYFETRNALCGENFSTRLSHLLNLGQLSPQTIIQMVNDYEKDHGENKSTYWIKFELLWREYFYWLYHFHQEDFFRSHGLNGGHKRLAPITLDAYLEQMNQHELIRAMNKELMQTGFLSNRSRQIYVSYLVHETDLDWRYGAWFFQHFLKDYDLYSNWGNWLYGSGNGTDSRGPRYFKISKQLAQYDPNGSYIRLWS